MYRLTEAGFDQYEISNYARPRRECAHNLAYWRAKEGELARTILALPTVKAARVHIAEAPTEVFQNKSKPSASVTITTRSAALTAEQALSVRHLVAGAVSGLQASDVAVIDSVHGLMASAEDAAAPSTAGDAKAAEIKANVERLLAARVGPNSAVVEVTVAVITDREEVNERTLDPQGKVAISTEVQDKSGSSTGNDGTVTVASNLPDGAGAAGGSNQRQTADELATLRELVASAVGLNPDRGDVLTLKSLPFQQPVVQGTLAEAGFGPALGQIDLMAVLQLAVLALVALVMGLFVLRPLLLSSSRAVPRLAAPALALSLPRSTAEAQALSGEIDDGAGEVQASPQDPALTDTSGDPVARLRLLIEDRQAESMEILRSWMEYDEEAA